MLWSAATADGNQVVIKLYRDAPISSDSTDAITEFEHETRARAVLSHPNILPVLDWGVDVTGDERVPFVVLPYCEIGDLRTFLKGRSFVPLDTGLQLLRQLAAAIDYAHLKGFLHGDIKPENVLFWHSPDHACLSDFGASRQHPQRVEVSRTLSGPAGPGTPIYLSPEELRGEASSHASDIYAFGLVAFELLTGARPVIAKSAYLEMQARIEGALKPARVLNPLLSGEVERAFFSALNVDPTLRPVSASRFIEFLQLGGATATSYAAPAGRSSGPASPLVTSPARRPFTGGQKLALITAIITALVTLATAVINVAPQLMKSGVPRSAADSSGSK